MYFLFGVLYWIFSAVTIGTAGTGNKIRNIAKPLTIPLLAVFYFLGTGRPEAPVLAALFFSTAGDLLLLRQSKKRFFLAGLFSFLTGHIAYTVYFLGSIETWSLVPPGIIGALPVYVAGEFFVRSLLSGKKRILKVPVFIYVAIICGMNLSTLCRLGNYSAYAFWLPFTGSIFYLISDTLLGVRNFKRRIPQISRVISLTYQLAQFLLILGILEST